MGRVLSTIIISTKLYWFLLSIEHNILHTRCYRIYFLDDFYQIINHHSSWKLVISKI